MPKRLNLKDAIVLITGAGQGIGLCLLKEAMQRGAIPIAVEFNADSKGDLEQLIGGRGQVHIVDVRNQAAMENVAQSAIEEFGGIDVVIANAGIERVGLIQDMPPEDFEAVIETNLLGVYRTIKPTLNTIVERGGHVLAISSIGALIPFTLAAAYGTSKSGVDMLMRVLRMELGGVGATAGCAYFGFVQTPMATNLFANPIVEKAMSRMPSRFVGLTPLPTPERIAALILDRVERRKARTWAPRMVNVTFYLRSIYSIFDDFNAKYVLKMPELVRDIRSLAKK